MLQGATPRVDKVTTSHMNCLFFTGVPSQWITTRYMPCHCSCCNRYNIERHELLEGLRRGAGPASCVVGLPLRVRLVLSRLLGGNTDDSAILEATYWPIM